jgi:uncharacterized protein YbjT (DUF2867 family)
MSDDRKQVFVTGGTGYLGKSLIENLVAKNFNVNAVARPRSSAKLPAGCNVIIGDVLNAQTYQDKVPTGSTVVHLVGTPHPAPWKGAEFQSIDLVSLQQSVLAAKHAGVDHFVFVSVAHPAPMMKTFIDVRMKCEQIIRDSGLSATILRPWYILGPGHYWPYLLIPFYKLFETIPSTRESAVRLGLVKHQQMVNTIARAVAAKPAGVQILETAELRSLGTA